MPPHYWIPIKSSSCQQRKRELEGIVGRNNVLKMWHGRSKGRCYAVVAGDIDAIPADLLAGEPIQVEDDDDLVDA